MFVSFSTILLTIIFAFSITLANLHNLYYEIGCAWLLIGVVCALALYFKPLSKNQKILKRMRSKYSKIRSRKDISPDPNISPVVLDLADVELPQKRRFIDLDLMFRRK